MRCARTTVGRIRTDARHEKKKRGVYGRGIVMTFAVDNATHNTSGKGPRPWFRGPFPIMAYFLDAAICNSPYP
jgi:hypothetical protein